MYRNRTFQLSIRWSPEQPLYHRAGLLQKGRLLQPKQIFYERDVLLSTMDDVLQTVEVTLYFLNNEGILTGEKRTIELYEGQTLAENLIAALLEGPQNRELSRAAPEDFQVNFVALPPRRPPPEGAPPPAAPEAHSCPEAGRLPAHRPPEPKSREAGCFPCQPARRGYPGGGHS